MPDEQRCVVKIGAIRVFGETVGGEWLPVGSARVEQYQGRDVLRLTLDASPTTGRLCVSLPDIDILRSEAQAAGHA